MFFYALAEATQLVHILIHLPIQVEINVAQVLLQSPKLAGLSLSSFLARSHIGQLDIEDILQLHTVIMVQSTVVHPPVEKDLHYVGRAEDVKNGLQCGARQANNVDDVGTNRGRGRCPQSNEREGAPALAQSETLAIEDERAAPLQNRKSGCESGPRIAHEWPRFHRGWGGEGATGNGMARCFF